MLEEIAKTCYVTAIAVMGEVGTQARSRSHYAPDAMKARILPRVCSGECKLAICMTEPHAGTDIANYRTNAIVDGNIVRLTGVKTLISRVDEAEVFIVFSRIDGRAGAEGIGCVLVGKGTPGFSTTARYHPMGSENLAEIQFDHCELLLENLIIRENGFRKLLRAFNTQRCLNPSISLGLAEGAFEEAIRYARDRTAFRERIGGAARNVAARHQRRAADPRRVGFTDEFPGSRLYRAARYRMLGGGTTETLRDLVGKKLFADFDPVDGFLSMKTF